MASSEAIVETERNGRVGIIRLVNERGRNALTTPMREAFSAALHDMTDDPDVRAILLIGRGKAFCAGGDLGMMRDESDPWCAHQRLDRTSRWLTVLIRCPKPVVVGVNGAAVGGGIGLVVAGDVILAAEKGARFISGFMRLGLMPDMGMMYTLPRLIGMARAKAFLFGNESWTAREAEAAGLVAGVVPDEELEARCLDRAAFMAAGPIEGFGLAKSIMSRTFESGLDEMLTYESLGQPVVYATQAMREGLDALAGNRAADFAAATERENATRVTRRRRA